MLDLEKVPGDAIHVNFLKGWDVGGRKSVLDVSLSWHTKIQGQFSNQQRAFSQLLKEQGTPLKG